MSEVVEAQTTLRDHLASAFEQHDAPQEQSPTQDRPRDEVGRFASKDTPEAAPADQSAKPEATGQTLTEQNIPVAKPRPTSWKKDYEEHWGKLDPTLQDYIQQREADYAKGVSMYKQNWESAAPIYEAIQPFMPALQQHNIDPKTWITSLGNAHQMLAMGTPEQKMQMFAKLATDYGVPIQALTGQQYDPQFSMMAQELSQLKNQWQQFQSTREQQEQAQIQTEIQSFSKDKPHFEAVRETMAQLLQSGVVDNLQAAYDKAIRLNDDIWQQSQAQAQQAKAAEEANKRQQQVAAAKAKAVSPRSMTPTGKANTGSGKSVRDILAEQFQEIDAGRV